MEKINVDRNVVRNECLFIVGDVVFFRLMERRRKLLEQSEAKGKRAMVLRGKPGCPCDRTQNNKHKQGDTGYNAIAADSRMVSKILDQVWKRTLLSYTKEEKTAIGETGDTGHWKGQ